MLVCHSSTTSQTTIHRVSIGLVTLGSLPNAACCVGHAESFRRLASISLCVAMLKWIEAYLYAVFIFRPIVL